MMLGKLDVGSDLRCSYGLHVIDSNVNRDKTDKTTDMTNAVIKILEEEMGFSK